MKRATLAMALSLALLLSVSTAMAYESMLGPTGLIRSTPEKASAGYTLFAPCFSTTTYLIDMQGNLAHTWESDNLPGLHAVLLPNGNLLRAASLGDARPVRIGGSAGRIEEYDWSGKLVWSYTLMDENHVSHHTFDRMPNGNTLILAWERVTPEQMKAKGRTRNFPPKEGVEIMGLVTKDFWVDFIREVNPKGETVWEWHLLDHIGKGPDKIDIDYVLPAAVGAGEGYSTVDWSHFNTCQYVPEKDLIVTNSRNLAELYVIDKKTGNIVYRWGNPSAYGKGKAPSYYDDGDQEMFGSHCASMLPSGNIIAFDNGSERPERRRSRIVEIDPATGKIVWQYEAKIAHGFYSDRQGAVQKLANGNYFVTSTNQGHLFEVTPDKEVVWEYVSPVFGSPNPKVKTRISAVFSDEREFRPIDMANNFVHRAYRYGPDFPGFKGKDLTKKQPFTEKFPSWQEFAKKAHSTAYETERK